MRVASVRVKMNSKGVQSLLKSPEIRSLLLGKAEAVAAAAGEGNVVLPVVGKRRAVVYVAANTDEAKLAEANSRALTRAVDAARG